VRNLFPPLTPLKGENLEVSKHSHYHTEKDGYDDHRSDREVKAAIGFLDLDVSWQVTKPVYRLRKIGVEKAYDD